jgi:diacylglycerol kinase family enzyme
MKSFGMFTENGSYMVGRIAAAGEKLAAADGTKSAWQWAQRELSKLATADEFGEATDTAVREEVYDVVVAAGGDGPCDFYL